MQLKTLLNQLTKRFKYILLISLLGVGVGLGVTLVVPNTYTAAINIYVYKEVESPQPGVYSYDGYYAQQASEAYTDTVKSVFESGDILSSALDEQGILIEDLKSFQGSLTVDKVAPQLIEVKLTRENQGEASGVIQAISQKVDQKIRELNNGQANRYLIKQVTPEPLLTYNQLPILLTALVGLMLGFCGSIFIFSVVAYVNNNES